MSVKIKDTVVVQRAKGTIRVRRPMRWIRADGVVLDIWDRAAPPAGEPDPSSYVQVDEEEVYNVKTTVGIDFLHTQGYGTSPAANGLNYLGLSNDSLTETTASTTLSNEIAANGLSRAIGAFAHTAGQTTSTIDKTFTCTTSSQSCQKAALFTASSSGTMAHALSFTQRTLQVGDQIQITYTITLS